MINFCKAKAEELLEKVKGTRHARLEFIIPECTYRQLRQLEKIISELTLDKNTRARYILPYEKDKIDAFIKKIGQESLNKETKKTRYLKRYNNLSPFSQ